MLDLVFRSSRLNLARHSSAASQAEVEWDHVTRRHPCPVCGSESGCHRHTLAEFVCCSRQPSEWPLTNGGWLHRIGQPP